MTAAPSEMPPRRGGPSATAALEPAPHTGEEARIAVGGLLGGRYRLRRRIGAGGMATIFHAWDESLERDVAVKVLHGHLADDPVLLARFRTEARHAAALVHPHIVNVFDQGVADLPYIVMEYVDGPSLREVLVARGRLPPPEALAVLEPVCRALGRAHARGVIHRDIKPENVLVAADGTPKVADFGIARAVAATTSHTQTGTLVGSVHYMAPELVDGLEASAASDQYAVGVLLFELLTGRKPLPGDSPMAVALRHAREPLPPPSRFVSDSTRALDKVVATATAIVPTKRYPDMAAFVTALRNAVPEGAKDVIVATPEDDTLVIPAEAQETVSVDLTTPVGSRAASTAGAPTGRLAGARRASRLVLGLVVVAAVVAGAGFAYWNYVLAPYMPIPQLEGLTQSAAVQTADEDGFDVLVADERFDLGAAEGQILSQDPQPGGLLRAGGEVAVVVSLGPAPVELVSVVGEPRDSAEDRLTELRLEVGAVSEDFSDTVPVGHVITQDPEPGATVREGSAVDLVVSKGVRQVAVPDLSNRTEEEAAALLEEAGLSGDFETDWSDDVPEVGTVVSQGVDAGRRVNVGSTVEATISRGPLTFDMPNMRGDSVEDARAELEDMALVVDVEGVQRPSFGPFRRGSLGLVEEQLPQPGEPVQRGDRVRLFTYVD